MKIIRNELENKLNIRTEKDFPTKGVEFIDIMPLIMDKICFEEIINKFVQEIQKYSVDYIIAPEARGFLLGPIIANKLNVGFIPVRKVGKIPPSTVECRFTYEKEYGKDEMELPKLVDDVYKDKNFYIVDDICATGNTMRAIKDELESLGGKVRGKGVIMNIKALNNEEELFSVLDVEEE